MQTRLTIDSRRILVKAVIAHKYKPIVQELQVLHTQAAKEAYEAYYTPDEVKRMNALPAGWLKVDVDMDFAFKPNGSYQTYSLRFDGSLISNYGTEPARFSSLHTTEFQTVRRRFQTDRNGQSNSDPTTPWYKIAAVARERERQCLLDMIADSRKIDGIIAQYTTVEKLFDAWPEMAMFEDRLPAPAVKSQAIALPIAELNKQFALP